MKKNKEMNELMKLVQNMSSEEKKSAVDQILAMLRGEIAGDESDNCNSLVESHVGRRPDCPHCKAKANLGYIVKRGFNKDVQRYQCKSCGKLFVASTNTAFENTRKGADVWREFITLTISGATLAECVEKCDICYYTAFSWRHKVLNVFNVQQDATKMSGIIQMDEMMMPLSYKGNHVRGKVGSRRLNVDGAENSMTRKAYKRGSDNKSTSSKDKACVLCMVENHGKNYYGAVPGVGFMQPEMLDATVKKVVNKETAVLLVDNYKVTANYLSNNDYKFMTLLSNVSDNPHDHKPEIHGDLHLQHVNNAHHQIRKFLAGYCGVSSKYLGNYVSLFMWLKNAKVKNQGKNLKEISVGRAAEADCYIPHREIVGRPAIPGSKPLCA